MDELESQNDAHVEGILGKVRTLKSVRSLLQCFFTSAALKGGVVRMTELLTDVGLCR
jgi:hypothetical protein